MAAIGTSRRDVAYFLEELAARGSGVLVVPAFFQFRAGGRASGEAQRRLHETLQAREGARSLNGIGALSCLGHFEDEPSSPPS